MISTRSTFWTGLKVIQRRMSKCLPIAIICILFFAASMFIFMHTRWNVDPEIEFANKENIGSQSNYAVVIDAGSSGSRIYMYEWPPHSGAEHELLSIMPIVDLTGEPLVQKVQPGLSSFASHPQDVIKYLSPLLKFAESHIPVHQHKSTPLYILATAGMRLLSTSEQDAILSSVRLELPKTTNLYFPSKNIDVISGKQEGIFQWLAINYALGMLNHSGDHSSLSNAKTVGIMDMGGASVQIAFEIQNRYQLKKPEVMAVNIGCTDDSSQHIYKIYVNTFLGFGANEKLEHHRIQLILREIKSLNQSKTLNVIKDPCYPPGKVVTVSLSKDIKSVIKSLSNKDVDIDTVNFEGVGLWESCVSLVQDLVEFNEPGVVCPPNECSTNIKTRPPLAFNSSKFYGFSEFWYSMDDVFSLGGKYNYKQYFDAAKHFCETGWGEHHDKFQSHQYPKADPERLETQCFKSSWLLNFLHRGLGFPSNYDNLMSSPNTVEGKVVHWTLGATLYKTRFYPLRAIQATKDKINRSSSTGYFYQLNSFFFVICFLLVICAICGYIYRLRLLNSRHTYNKVDFNYSQLESKMLHRSNTCPTFH